jgi:hypothetical protein
MAVFYPEYARSRHQAAAQAEFQVAFVFHRVVSPNMPILSDFAQVRAGKCSRPCYAGTGWEL